MRWNERPDIYDIQGDCSCDEITLFYAFIAAISVIATVTIIFLFAQGYWA